MKNIIVLYTTFLLLSLFSACTTKDKPVIYPNTGGPVAPTFSKKLKVGDNETVTSEFTKSGPTITFNAGTYTVSLIFANESFAAKTYTTSAAPTSDNDVAIMITDAANSEVYQVESGKAFKIENKSSGNTIYTSISLETSLAPLFTDPAQKSITVSFTVEQ